MSIATSAITDKFKNTYVYTYGMPESVVQAVQEAYFRMGFSYFGKRTAFPGPHSYIRVDEDGQMFRASGTGQNLPASYGAGSAARVFYTHLRDSAEAVRRIKRQEGSAQKKRAAARKWDATATKRTLETCPVQPACQTIVAVKLTDGMVLSGLASTFRWTTIEGMNNIVSYKVTGIKQEKKPVESRIGAADFVQAVAADMGKGVAVPVEVRHGVNIPAGLPKSTLEAFDSAIAKLAEPADTNPKKQYGLASIPLNMWSPLASAYGALGLYNGSLKYGAANFCNTKVEASIYIAAAMRHLSAWAAGEEFDPADGVPNLGGVLANIAILLEARAAGMLIDDRLRMTGYLKERDTLKAIVPALQAVHAGKTPKHYTLEG